MNAALIFAGGTGSRLNSKTRPKQFLEMNGKPIIIHTIEHFEAVDEIDVICVVCLEAWIDHLKHELERFSLRKVKCIVPGGKNGQQSIYNGLTALSQIVDEDALVLIHDGVRPLIDEDTIVRNIECAREKGNAVTVTPAQETIISVDENEQVCDVTERSHARLARAPQTFRLGDILGAHHRAIEDGEDNMIDSATLMRHYGYSLNTVPGPVENIKITTAGDFYIFRAILEARENSQIWGL